MALGVNRRPVMTLYSGACCPYSHRVRLVLAEKNIGAEIVEVGDHHLPEDLIDLNPYNSVPTLVDRELVIYTAPIIAEYLDERYPHPPLLPVDPVSRARARLYAYRIERDWYVLLDDVIADDGRARESRKALRDGLTVIAPIFEQMPFFMSEDYGLADCTLAPLLWRLRRYDVQLPPKAKPLLKYAERLFARPAFRLSLSSAENDMQ